ncbi:MAG: GAF domain-containing protein [Gammaproteobacteria bacterium]|nr:GAF domain-containing protein [Gammaproteobacteria bacterium]
MATGREGVLADRRDTSVLVEHWRVTASDEAIQQLRTAMASATGLLKVTEAAATVILQLTAAQEVSISLLDGEHHWDVIDVSADPERGTLHPDLRYRLSDYPVGSDRLLSGRGYVGNAADDPVMVEYALQNPDAPVGSIMSAPIIALGGVHGEIFLVREVGAPPFTRDELDLVSECAPLLGARLPALIAAYRDQVQDKPNAMAGLAKDLEALFDDRHTE